MIEDPETWDPEGLVIAGMDVGKRHNLDISVVEPDPANPGKLRTRSIWLGIAQSFDHAFQLIKRYKVRGVGVDIYPELEACEDFQRKLTEAGIQCWRVEFWTTPRPEGEDMALTLRSADGIAKVSKTRIMDRTFYDIRDGLHVYPCDATNRQDWMAQMTASIRQFVKGSGKTPDRWKWTKGPPDHYRLAGVYRKAIATIMMQSGDFFDITLDTRSQRTGYRPKTLQEREETGVELWTNVSKEETEANKQARAEEEADLATGGFFEI